MTTEHEDDGVEQDPIEGLSPDELAMRYGPRSTIDPRTPIESKPSDDELTPDQLAAKYGPRAGQRL